MIEPHAAITVATPRVMPPKQDAKHDKPKISMAEDAKRCNARLRRILGHGETAAAILNEASRREAEARRYTIAARALEIIRRGPISNVNLVAALGVRKEKIRDALAILKAERKVIAHRSKTLAITWTVAE